MLTVDDYGAIRRARRDGKSIRQIAREFDHSRTPSGRFSSIPSPIQRLGIASHQNSVPSTRSSTRSFWTTRPRRPSSVTPRRRCSVAFATNTTTAAATPRCNAICSSTAKRKQETFIPLGHLPGERLEADFGHIHVDFPDGRRLVSFLVTTWAYSNYPFVLALPFERTEAILEGMVTAFEFFGCVPKEVWWDNPKTVATLILARTRTTAPSPIRGAGQPLRLQSPLLHAGTGQRKARRREHREGRTTPLLHSGPARDGPRRAEPVFPAALRSRASSEPFSRSSARS